MARLARKLRLTDYFTLAFGTMVGVGWLVVMDDWLERGGPLGGILGFAIGGAVPVPLGHLCGPPRLGLADAGGGGGSPPQRFPPPSRLVTGWLVRLALFVLLPW